MTEDVLSDLTRLRELAEQGRRTPLLGGRQMVIWGSASFLATVIHASVVTKLLSVPLNSIAFVWFGLMGLAVLISRSGIGPIALPKPESANARIEAGVWQVGGSFLGLLAATMVAAAFWRSSQSGSYAGFATMGVMFPATFGVYAIALRAAGEAAQLPWLVRTSWWSFVFAGFSGLCVNTIWAFPVAAVGIFVAAILPGLKLIKIETAYHG
ncbi:MAG: hypothetical protein RL367_1083 [Pseudomonadota bacterium]|jgi:hypothetical protein